jgi:hypothetical protein
VVEADYHDRSESVDPLWTTAYTTRNYGYMIYNTLLTLDANLQPQPQMVETWAISPDGLTYTLAASASDAHASAAGAGANHPMGRL